MRRSYRSSEVTERARTDRARRTRRGAGQRLIATLVATIFIGALLVVSARPAAAAADYTAQDVDAAESIWFGESGTLFEYQYEYFRFQGGATLCGPQIIKVRVASGAIVEATSRDTNTTDPGCNGSEVPVNPSEPSLMTVNDMFTEARDILLADNPCRTITGTFDAALGYPSEISADFGMEGGGGICVAVSGATGFKVLTFVALDHNAAVQADLDAAEALWLSAAPAAGYTMNYSPFCFCFFPNGIPLITVGESFAPAATSSHWNLQTLAGPNTSWGPWTVSDLFANIQDAIDAGYLVGASFDPTYGHPTVYSIDQNLLLADEELSIITSAFTPEYLTCHGLPASIIGDAAANTLTGTSLDDVVWAGAGDDEVSGLEGNDTICGNEGKDTILGGDGDDTLSGGAGNDIVRGNPGADIIDGNEGNDRLLGGIDADTIDGGPGNDYLGGFGGPDILNGGPGDETIFGGFGADTIDGGDGNDLIFGLIGDDTIDGGNGDDTLTGDRGNDIIRGGPGDDLIRGGNANDQLFGDDGDDSVNGGRADDQLSGGADTDSCSGNKHIFGDTADATCEFIFGVP